MRAPADNAPRAPPARVSAIVRPMHANPDQERTVGDVVRYGTVAEVSYDPPRVVVAVGDLRSAPVLWGAQRWGQLRIWAPPSVGEQVALICPEGDIAAASAAYSLPCDAFPGGPGDERLQIAHDGGFVFEFVPAEGVLRVRVPDDGFTELNGRVQVNGDFGCSGKIRGDSDLSLGGSATADGDVKAGSVSLKSHVHLNVKFGTDLSGGPKP